MKKPRVLVTGLGSVLGTLLLLPAHLPGQSVAPFQLKLVASDAASGDQFGCAVAADGGSLVVGSFVDDRGTDSGAVYLYQFEDGDWHEQDKMAGLDTEEGDQFGFSVSVSEARVDGVLVATSLVGAPLRNEMDGGGMDAGAAYLFVVENGRLRQEDKLTASDAAPGDGFGTAVAVDGGRAVIGAPGRDREGRDAGAVYVFERGGNSWPQRAILEGDDPGTGDRFGRSLALAGDLVVVGAPFDKDQGTDSGSVYVFRRRGAEWLREAKLTELDTAPFDAFGYAVATDGPRIVVGAPRHGRGGAVYFYRPTQTGWQLETRLDAPGGSGDGQFGVSVATDSGMALVGARLANDAAPDAGAVSLFRRTANGWVAVDRLTAGDAARGDELGLAVALSGPTVVAGAYLDDNDFVDDAGSVYLLAPEADLSLRLASAHSTAGGGACRRAHEIVGSEELVPGCGVEYTLVVKNTAGSDEVSRVVEFPATQEGDATLTGATWTCSATGGGRCTASGIGDISDRVTLPAGAQLLYTLTAHISSRARGTLDRSASLEVPAGVLDPTPELEDTDTAPLTPVAETSVELSWSFPLAPMAETSVAKTSEESSRFFKPYLPTPACAVAEALVEPGEVVPGCRVIYTLEVSNEGPSHIDRVPVRVEETSGLLSDLAWTCTVTGGGRCAKSGRGNVDDRVAVPRRGRLTYSLRGTVPPDARGTLDISASVELPDDVLDPTPNDPPVESATLKPVAEVSVDLRHSFDPADPTPGCAAAGNRVKPEVVPGCRVDYTFEVRSEGPSHIDNVPVSMAETSGLLPDLTWTCTATGGGMCKDRGSGNVADRVALPGQGSVTYSLRGTVPPAAVGTLDSSASVALPEDVIDPTEGDQSELESATLRPVVTFETGLDTVDLSATGPPGCPAAPPEVPGCPVGRKMTITNRGPSAARANVCFALQVVDPDPGDPTPPVCPAGNPARSRAGQAEQDLEELEWTCTASNGAVCSNGQGNVDDEAALPVDGELTYDLTATVDGLARGELRTTASVDLRDGAVPLEPIVIPPVDPIRLVPVAVFPVPPLTVVAPSPGTRDFTIGLSNDGPSGVGSTDGSQAILNLTPAFSPGEGMSPNTGTWTCKPTPGADCAAEGSGDIIDSEMLLPADTMVAYELTGAVVHRPGLLVIVHRVCNPTFQEASSTSPQRVSGVMKVDGDFGMDGTVFYKVTFKNELGRTQFNNRTLGRTGEELDEFVVELPSELSLVDAKCVDDNRGCKCDDCVLNTQTDSVTWNGTICPNQEIEFTIKATVKPGTAVGTTISAQGQIHYDTEGDGINEATAMTSPAEDEPEGPTTFTVEN